MVKLQFPNQQMKNAKKVLINNNKFHVTGFSEFNGTHFACVLTKYSMMTFGHFRKVAFCKIYPYNSKEMILEINYLDPTMNIFFKGNIFTESDEKIEIWIKDYFLKKISGASLLNEVMK